LTAVERRRPVWANQTEGCQRDGVDASGGGGGRSLLGLAMSAVKAACAFGKPLHLMGDRLGLTEESTPHARASPLLLSSGA
jgi:hypothetical protein